MKTKMFFSVLMTIFTSAYAFAETRPQLLERAATASSVLQQVVTIPDKGIPRSLLSRATCVATIPNVLSGGIVFGARYGKGLVSCRIDANHWSHPSFVTIAGGSWGLQFGIESTDVVLVFVNANAIERLSHDNFTIGGDVSVAAGPLGRDAKAETDYKLGSEIYSYSRSRGLFAGLTFSGSALTIDHDDNAMVYGRAETARALLTARATGAANGPDVYAHALMNYAK